MNYKKLFRQIELIFQKEDPYYLISSGSPDDEYSEEIANIIVQLKLSDNKKDFQRRLEKKFRDSFEDEIDEVRLKNLVDQIFEFKNFT